MRIAMIGGSGAIGRKLLAEYGADHELIDVSRQSGLIQEYSKDELLRALRASGAEALLLLAARKVNPKEEQSYSLYEGNVRVVEAGLEAARELGLTNVVYLSSRCVYDNRQANPIAEDGQILPINYYGISKFFGEQLCLYYNRHAGLHVKILRLSQVIGADALGFMVSTFMRAAAENQPLTIFGRSQGRRDYIYVRDVCRAIMCALNHPEAEGVFNIGSGQGSSNRDLAEAVVRGYASESEIRCEEERPEDTSQAWLDIQKARDVLAFSPAYDLEETFRDLAQREQAGAEKA